MSSAARRANLRAEYEAALRYAIRIDETTWQVGAILVGGSLAAVALSFSSSTTHFRLAPVFVSVAGILATLSWFLLVRRNTDFISIAKARMIAIELELGTELYTHLQEGSSWGFTNVPFPTTGYAPLKVVVREPKTFQIYRLLVGGIISVLITVIIYAIVGCFPNCL